MVFVLVLLLVQAAQQAPPRDTKPVAGSSLAMIAGRVVDAETGTPISGAGVHIIPTRSPELASRIDTGQRGEFEATGLAADSYRIFVTPPPLQATHLPIVVNNDLIALMSGSTKSSIELRDGEIRDDLLVKLERAVVVEGRVIDEFGEPMANIRILTERSDRLPVPRFGPEPFSDERGMFRAFGLAPGAYRVCAAPTPNWRMGQPSGGDLARRRYAETCYPSSPAGSGERVVLSSKAEPPVLTIVMSRMGAFTIAGRATSESGDPAATVTIVRRDRSFGHSSSIPIEVKDGHFVARGVPPGEYSIRATSRNQRTGLDETTATEYAGSVIRVVDSDVVGLELVTSKGATVRGRIVPEVAIPGKPPLTVASLDTIETLSAGPHNTPQPTLVRSDMSFEIAGIREPAMWEVSGLPPGWVVASARYRGVDVTDMATRYASNSDPADFEIAVSPRSARLKTRTVDVKGAPVLSAHVLLFPTRGDRWRSGPLAEQKTLPDGTVELPPVRPGDYFVAAISPMDVLSLINDPAAFATLKRVASRIVLAEGDERSIDLVVVSLAEAR